jgi:hypothetical protein
MNQFVCALISAIGLSLISTACNSSSTEISSPTGSADAFGYVWKPVKEGGGGFITGLSLHPNGTLRFARTDTYGLYRWDGDAWTQALTAQSVPPEDIKPEQGGGVQSVAVAPSDATRVYMHWNEHLYRSDNAGKTWKRTALNAFKFDANDDFRTFNAKLVVDPKNADVVFVGTPSDGLWRTQNGGSSWTELTEVPKGTLEGGKPAGITGLVISGLNSQIVFAASNRKGVFQSKNGGTNWQRISDDSSSNSLFTDSSLSADGTLFVSTNDSVYRYRQNVWERKTPVNTFYTSVAADPLKAGRVYAINDAGTSYRSLDDGENWTALEKSRVATGDAVWLGWTDQDYFANAQAVFDPVKAGRLWLAQGTGVWFADTSDTTPSIVWNAQSRGIEQRVGNDVAALPGAKVITAGWDFGLIQHDNPDVFPLERGPTKRFNSVWNLSVSAGNPNLIVAAISDHRAVGGCYYWCQIDGQSIQSGISSDGGKTWEVFKTFPTPAYDTAVNNLPRASQFGFGNVVISADGKSIVWQPTKNGAPWQTQDRGLTWIKINLPGVPADEPGSHFAFFLDRKILTADGVLPNTFYLLHTKGVFKSGDGGISWNSVYPQELGQYSVFNAKLKSVPGKSGHLFFTPGPLDGVDAPFKHSTDGGSSWTDVSDVTRVLSFGFGKPQTSGGYATVFIAGKVKGVYGIWRSGDEGKTWTQISDYPMGIMDGIRAVEGDPETFGKVYLGFSGIGFAYGTPK